jgi:hypothetical protein
LPLQKEIRRMKLPDGWYDGEIVVHDEHGKPNFNLLQLAFDGSNRAQIVYFVFDAPYFKGYDMRECGSTQRRPLLQEALAAKPSDTVRFSSEFGTDPAQLVVAACQIGLEGVIGKRRDSRYVTRRSPDWIKLKCGHAPGIRHRRLHRSAGRAHRHRLAAARLLRRGRRAALRRQRAAAASTAPRCARCANPGSNKARPTRIPSRRAPCRAAATTGSSRTGGRSQFFGMDRDQFDPPSGVPGPAQGQAGPQAWCAQAKHVQARRPRP